jgi:hypothetical protein
MAETKNDALVAFDAFVETWGVKYDKAVECLIKDRDALLAFYDFPAAPENSLYVPVTRANCERSFGGGEGGCGDCAHSRAGSSERPSVARRRYL